VPNQATVNSVVTKGAARAKLRFLALMRITSQVNG
jgi:hypothetical protein